MTTDVFIVWHRFQSYFYLTQWLKLKGAVIHYSNDDLGVTEATIPTYMLQEIKNKECVAHVRVMHTYPDGIPAIEVHPTDDAL